MIGTVTALAGVHLFTDADNTLWETDAVFAEAQLWLLREVETATGRRAPEAADRLAFLRHVDQFIAHDHPDRLRYPPLLLVRGLALALGGDGAAEAAACAVREDAAPAGAGEMVTGFHERLRAVPRLREGVREGLRATAELGVPVIVVTEERSTRVWHLLKAHELAAEVADVVSVRKTPEAFAALRREVGTGRAIMVGDQLDRDVAAAASAGFETVHYPGGFRPYWATATERGADHSISRFDGIVPLLTATPRLGPRDAPRAT